MTGSWCCFKNIFTDFKIFFFSVSINVFGLVYFCGRLFHFKLLGSLLSLKTQSQIMELGTLVGMSSGRNQGSSWGLHWPQTQKSRFCWEEHPAAESPQTPFFIQTHHGLWCSATAGGLCPACPLDYWSCGWRIVRFHSRNFSYSRVVFVKGFLSP